jgi:cysteine sulfinate desulfinase/cysteine desulfurase-like protein
VATLEYAIVRFSLGRSTTEQKLESAVAILKKVIQQLTI